jgi:hypothetical protein
MNLNFSVNPYLILAGTLLGMVTGMFWFSPLAFGNPWLKAMGLKMPDIDESGVSHPLAYGATTFAQVALSFVTGLMVLNLGVHGFHNGMLLGLLMWFGFNFSSVFKYIFFETRPWSLFLIDAGYDIACFTLTAGIFAQWQ